MRILIVGSDKIFAIENFYVQYLRELGCDVFLFSAQSIFFDYYQKNILNKIIFRTGFSPIYKKINKKFKAAVSKFNPEVIWVFKGMEIYPESLIWAKNKKIKLVNYNPDNPFIFSGKGSGNENVKKSIGLYDLHLTYNSAVKNEIETIFKLPAKILPFGYNVSDELYDICVNQPEIVKACFLGNPDSYRGEFIMGLAIAGIKIDVYGNNWNSYVKHNNIEIFNPIYGNDFWIILCRYRVQLNLMRPHNPDTHNMRSFEIPGIGGIQLAPETQNHKTYFEPGKEIFLFSDLSDCIEKIKSILSMSNREALMIRKQARIRSEKSGYSYKERAKQALDDIQLLK